MQFLRFKAPLSRVSMNIFASQMPGLSGYMGKIKYSERMYILNRSPAMLKPIGLCNDVKEYLIARYRSPSAVNRTMWIESLRNNHGLSVCPMCGSTGLGSLDHFLPKDVYPEFSCFPYNLVPSCLTCNKSRSTKSANAAKGEEFVHPYFDEGLIRRIRLVVSIAPPYESPKFDLTCKGTFGVEACRVKSHLDSSINSDRFRETVSTYWSPWWRKVNREKNRSAAKVLLRREMSDNRSLGRNSWYVAFLTGLHRDNLALDWMRINLPR